MADSIEFPSGDADAESEEAFSTPPVPDSSHLAPVHTRASQAIVGLIMIAVFIGGAVVVGQVEAPKPKPAADAAAAPGSTPAPETTAPAPAAPSEAVAAEIKELKTQLDGLSAQVKGFQEKLDTLPKPEPAPDAKPIQGKVDDLARSIALLVPLSGKMDKFDERVGSIEAALKSANDEVSELASEVKTLAAKAATPAPVASAEEIKPSPASHAPALSEGIDLFKAGKYKEAGGVFKKLETATPDDARIYYYEAFVNGLTTNNWQGETVRIAAKAATLEKAGATKPADIDAAFAELPANLKPWLAFFRKQVK